MVGLSDVFCRCACDFELLFLCVCGVFEMLICVFSFWFV